MASVKTWNLIGRELCLSSPRAAANYHAMLEEAVADEGQDLFAKWRLQVHQGQGEEELGIRLAAGFALVARRLLDLALGPPVDG